MPTLYQSKIIDVDFGENVTIIEPTNIYGCQVGNDTFIGPFTEIQKNVKIGENCKIQSHTFICELVTIGDNTVVAHGVMFINDLFATGKPANGDKKLWKSTQIGNNVSIGSNSTILPVSICDNVVIGAGSVVTKNINEAGIYVGNPAKKIRSLSV
ncbi:MAG: acyltransferase [Sulfuricurvum sp.]|nr:acyltransferase [Sulfuricurvum sp.]